MLQRVSRYLEVDSPRLVLLISGAHGINEFFSVALPPILPLLVTDFGISYAEAGFLVTVYFVMYTLFQLPAGFLADRVDKRWPIVAGMVLLSAGMGLAATAETYPILILSQMLAGIGGSTYHPAGMSLVSDVETVDTEGKAMGLHGLGGIVGTMLAPLLVGGIASLRDWRTALTVVAGVGVLYALGFLLLFREPPTPEQVGTPAEESIDGGSVEPLSQRIRSTVDGAVQLLFSWPVLGLITAKIAFGLQFGAVRTYTTSYVFATAGESASVANVVFFVLLAGGGIASIWFGGLADEIDRRFLLPATFLFAGVLVASTVLLPPDPLILLGWFFIVGMAVYAGLPVMNTLVSQYASRDSSGGLFGVTQTASALGSATAPILFGAIATRRGLSVAFPTIAVVSVTGCVVLLAFAVRVFEKEGPVD